MKIKEFKLSDEGYEVTLVWDTDEARRLGGVDIPFFLHSIPFRTMLLDCVRNELEED